MRSLERGHLSRAALGTVYYTGAESKCCIRGRLSPAVFISVPRWQGARVLEQERKGTEGAELVHGWPVRRKRTLRRRNSLTAVMCDRAFSLKYLRAEIDGATDASQEPASAPDEDARENGVTPSSAWRPHLFRCDGFESSLSPVSAPSF